MKILVILYIAARCALGQDNNVTPSEGVTSDPVGSPQQQTKPIEKTAATPESKMCESNAHYPLDTYYNSLKDIVNKKTPVERLDEISKDVLKEINSNPFYKIPKLDRKLREIAVLHPDVMEKLGVYVIPVKSRKSHTDEVPIDIKESVVEEAESKETKKGMLSRIPSPRKSSVENPMKSNLLHIIKQSEMIKSMTPVEKLRFIPQLKEAIVYEILKNTQAIDRISKEIAQREHHF
ncbi:hypothetical protein BgAZ_110430 [Babesia gibsoni]|uniref:Uncharacterized protein n=1 Tax=Babesia gibsoni TaxID=33632 RepID=A0AAD8UV77_BABGI|nr:hypothetical protein BgAZ_110430 [Babesia gibsoni]